MNALISPAGLKEILDAPGVRLLDASYGQPPADIRIGNALDFDIDAVANPDAILPHTLPTAETFGYHVSAMGISNDDHVIVYDRSGVAMAASRAWWMFRIFGHEKVQILDGGLPAWLKAGYPATTKTGAKAPAPSDYKAAYLPQLYKDRADMVDNLSSKKFLVLDARDPKRYSGEMQEPRPGMEGGHIPGSVNVPYASLIDPASGLFKQGPQLEAALSHVDRSKPIAISCGSGVTACVIALGLYQTGIKNAAVYGGSWAEWGGDLSLPKKKGNAP